MADTTDTTATTGVSVVNGASPGYIDDAVFHADVAYLEALWRRIPVGAIDLPVIDVGPARGVPLVFVPILEHLEFVYARQIRALSGSRRVITYRRREDRRRFVGLAGRAEELLRVLDALGLQQVDLVGHGDAAMVILEFAARYPQRCRSLVIIAQAADYQIAPHPFIWLLHELFLRLPVEHILPAWFLRRLVVNYIVASRPAMETSREGRRRDAIHRVLVAIRKGGRGRDESRPYDDSPDGRVVAQLPRHLIEEQFHKIALWPAVYKFSVLPIIHFFDMRSRLPGLTMPVLIINRENDVLSPEAKTRWLAEHLPNCAGYYLVPGHERFFIYSQAEEVNRLIETFYNDRFS